MKQRKQYTTEFKEGAVRLVAEQGRTLCDAAASLGLPSSSLSRWVRASKRVKGPMHFAARVSQHRLSWRTQIGPETVR